MANVKLPYGAGHLEVNVPDENLYWVASLGSVRKQGGTDLEIVSRAMENPIGCGRLSEVVKRGQSAVIIVDDVTRPTPAAKLLPSVIAELKLAGLKGKDISIALALGTHRVMTDDEIQHKCGPLDPEIGIINVDYNKQEEFVSIGQGNYGEKISVLKRVAEADVRIGLGNIVPHFYAGWGGGAKIVQPGICDEATTEATHTLGVLNDNILNLCTNPENIVRKEMEYIADAVGLDFIVNTVLDDSKKIIGCFAGHFIKAHRAAVKFAEGVYRPSVPGLADIVAVTANPSQIDYWQGIKGLVHAQFGLKPGGVVIFAMSAPEGIAGGNEKHTSTIMKWAVQEEEAIRNGIKAKASKDLIAMAFCICHRQMVNRSKVICIADGLDFETQRKLGFVPAKDMDEALKLAFGIAGSKAKVGVVTYAGAVVKPV